MSIQPLRLIVVDATDRDLPWARRARAAGFGSDGTARGRLGLSPVWRVGATLYGGVGAADATYAATGWTEAIDWALGQVARAGRPLGSLQVWCHGGWGSVRLGDSRLEEDALAPDHRLAGRLDALRDALAAGRDASAGDAGLPLVWFRCCSTFGHHGRRFAAAAAERLRCRVAGHTHVIGVLQSGLHSVVPGATAGWDEGEGVRMDAGRAVAAMGSSWRAPNTVTFLETSLPAGY
ncbi:MAG: hypothetical protein WKG00_28045 [Polyangiaceae bacterium]